MSVNTDEQDYTNDAHMAGEKTHMTVGEHTMGPWVVFHDKDEFAVMPSGRPGDICRGIAHGADAALIAAAPDTAARLREVEAELAAKNSRLVSEAYKSNDLSSQLAGTLARATAAEQELAVLQQNYAAARIREEAAKEQRDGLLAALMQVRPTILEYWKNGGGSHADLDTVAAAIALCGSERG